MGRGQFEQRVELPCKFGTLVAQVVRDDEDWKEIEIDLVSPDGKLRQVCLAGTDEYYEEGGGSKVHIHVWNGNDEDPEHCHYMNPEGECWYE